MSTANRVQFLNAGINPTEWRDLLISRRKLNPFFDGFMGHEVEKNIAANFSLVANGRTDTTVNLRSRTLQDLKLALETYRDTGNLPKRAMPNGNGNATGGTPTSVTAPTSGESIPLVSPNIFDAAKSVFDGVRTDQISPPATAADAHKLLWEVLPDTVKATRATDLIASSINRLASERRETLSKVVDALSPEVRGQVLTALETNAKDVVESQYRSMVEPIYHIDRSPGHPSGGYAQKYFQNWAEQVQTVIRFMGRNEDLNWEASEDQKRDAAKDTAVAAFRELSEGLQREVQTLQAQQTETPPEDSGPKVILVNTALALARRKLTAEKLYPVIAGWADLDPAEMHAMMAEWEAMEDLPTDQQQQPTAPAPERRPGTTPQRTGNRS